MKLFGKKDKFKAKTWEDITLRQFNAIRELMAEPDDYTSFNVIDYIYGIDSTSLPINELPKYSIAFLSKEIPNVKLKKHYIINGRKYDSNFDLTVVTAAQFIDYQSYIREGGENVTKLLSIFFVPEGHTYNDGYDIKQVQEDLFELDMCVISSAAFFFSKQLAVFVSLFQFYLTLTVEKMEMEETKKKELLEKLGGVDLANLVSLHTFSSIAK